MGKRQCDDFIKCVEKKCPICATIFVQTSSEWVYKRGAKDATLIFCSYKCMRQWDAEHEAKTGGKRKAERIRETTIRAVFRDVGRGMTLNQAALEHGISYPSAKNYKKMYPDIYEDEYTEGVIDRELNRIRKEEKES